jgi:outer membrane cobalamin receptor
MLVSRVGRYRGGLSSVHSPCRLPGVQSVVRWVCLAVVLVAAVAVRSVTAQSVTTQSVTTDASSDDAPFAGGVMDTVFVTAVAIRGGAAFPAVPGVTTVVQLEDAQGGADLAGLLATVAGLQLRRYGGLGAYALPSVRGSTAAQVQVLVDGLPLVDAQTGVVDLAALPLERYTAAEVYRGLVPAGFGGVGAAGAINLVSRDLPAGGSEVRLFGGSFGDAGARATTSVVSADGSRRGMLLVHGRRVDNRFAYLDHNQTFVTTGDDTLRHRVNAQVADVGFYTLGELNGAGGTLRTSGGFFRQDAGQPGPLGYPSPHATVRRDRWDARLTAADPRRVLDADLAVSRRREWLYDDDAEVGFDPPGTTLASSDDISGRLAWSPTWRVGSTDAAGQPDLELAATAGGGWAGQWYEETQAQVTRPRRERTTLSAFGSFTVRLPSPRLQLVSGWRWQSVRDDFPPVPALPWLPEGAAQRHEQDAVSPSLGAAWQVVPAVVILEGHWHESVRQPTWIELFGQPGGLEGNRELMPEEITGRDLSLMLRTRRGTADLRVAVFDQLTEQTITWLQSSRYTVRAVNIGRTRTRGLEIEARADLAAGVALSGSYTHQDARDRGPDPAYQGKELPYLPATEAYARLVVDRGTGWVPSLAVTHASSNRRDRYNQPEQRAPARTVISAALARTWQGGVWGRGRKATVTAEVVNLTANDVYDVEGYPLPGRSIRVSLHWR